jgi:hypothetical protein
MEVWMMSPFGKDDSITFFFKQNCPVSQLSSVWQNFSAIIAQREKVIDKKTNSAALSPKIQFD